MVPDLLDPDDPDWASFQDNDPDWFLRATSSEIRKFCGWHIAPNIQETVRDLRTGGHGIIMLPSRYVTEVDQLLIEYGKEPQVVPPTAYTWHQEGWIQRQGWSYGNDWYYSGYYYGNDPYYFPGNQASIAHCTMRHGYDILPDDVKQVAFELAQGTFALGSSGNVKSITSPGYKLELAQPLGMTLNLDQRNRLANYRIGMVG